MRSCQKKKKKVSSYYFKCMKSCKEKAQLVLRQTKFPLEFIVTLFEKGLLRSGLKFFSCDIMRHCKTNRVAGNLLMRLFVFVWLCCFNHKYFYKTLWLAVDSIRGVSKGCALWGRLRLARPACLCSERCGLGSSGLPLSGLCLWATFCTHISEIKMSIPSLLLLSPHLFLILLTEIIKLKYRKANSFRNILKA